MPKGASQRSLEGWNVFFWLEEFLICMCNREFRQLAVVSANYFLPISFTTVRYSSPITFLQNFNIVPVYTFKTPRKSVVKEFYVMMS